MKSTVLVILGLFLLAACGCSQLWRQVPDSTGHSDIGRNTGRPLDQQAARLHELCGALLLFESSRHRMPVSLDELCSATSLESSVAIDPVTSRPFAYKADGFAASPAGGRLVIVAAAKPQATGIWAVQLGSGTMIQAEVVRLAVSAFETLGGIKDVGR